MKKTVLEVMAIFPPQGSFPVYVVDCDVDANAGVGNFTLTNDPKIAMLFDDVGAALEFWRRPSKVRPVRDDRKPNRPLTALTVSPVTIDI